MVSNYQQYTAMFQKYFFFLIIAGYSWQLLTKTKKGSGSKSKSDWVSFSDAKVLHFNLTMVVVGRCWSLFKDGAIT